MKIILPVIFFLSSLPVFSQDVTGIWRGYFNEANYNRELEGTVFDSRYKFEIQLDQKENRFEGVTYSYRSTIFYGKASAMGTVNPRTNKVLLDELKILEVRMAGMSDACIMRCFLQYSKSGDEEFLEGTYSSMNTRDSSNCGRGTVFLRRVVTSDFYKEPFLAKRDKEKPIKTEAKPAEKKIVKTNPVKPPATKPTAPVATIKKNNNSSIKNKPIVKANPPDNKKTIAPKTNELKIAVIDSVKKIDRKSAPAITPKVLASRENEVVKTIITNSNEIVINVYDNGTIDNDTVSVYLDKKLVVSKQRLTEKAITVKFQLDDINDYHELVMVAENLGEIPPNTSLMVVNAGTKQYEVRITSTEQKNAVVIFKYEKIK